MDDFETHEAAESPETQAVQVQEYPVPLKRFAEDHLKGTSDEVYTRLLRGFHGERPRTPSEWRALIETARKAPAHRDAPRPATARRR
jgi:hypothetical protein